MDETFPPQDEAAPVVEPAPLPAPPAATYMVDRILAQVIVAKVQDGHKIGEFPCNALPLLYPFDALPKLGEMAVEQVRASQEAAGE